MNQYQEDMAIASWLNAKYLDYENQVYGCDYNDDELIEEVSYDC